VYSRHECNSEVWGHASPAPRKFSRYKYFEIRFGTIFTVLKQQSFSKADQATQELPLLNVEGVVA